MIHRAALTLATALLLAACSGETPVAAKARRARPLVCVTIPPLQLFVQRLAGDLVDCEVILPAGADPEHWVPDRATVQHLLDADLVLFHGAELESWHGKVGLPRSRCWVICTGFDASFIKIEGAVTHTHGGTAHTHDGVDPYLWLDLGLAARQAGVVARAVESVLPAHAPEVRRNLAALERDLTAERDAHAALRLQGEIFGATRRVYAYWARSVGVELCELDLPDVVRPEQAWAAVSKLIKRGARTVLSPRPLDPAIAAVFEKARITPVVFDPGYDPGAGVDLLVAMARNRARLAER